MCLGFRLLNNDTTHFRHWLWKLKLLWHFQRIAPADATVPPETSKVAPTLIASRVLIPHHDSGECACICFYETHDPVNCCVGATPATLLATKWLTDAVESSTNLSADPAPSGAVVALAEMEPFTFDQYALSPPLRAPLDAIRPRLLNQKPTAVSIDRIMVKLAPHHWPQFAAHHPRQSRSRRWPA
jgi:hypothetical protein